MVKGIKEFLAELSRRSTDISEQALHEIEAFAEDSCCPMIRFEDLKKTSGISKTDECVISTRIFEFPLEHQIRVIMHEISHQYQYKNHGKNIALDIYLSDTPLEHAAEKLLMLERSADRLAVMKTKQLLKKCGYSKSIFVIERSLDDRERMARHVQIIREEVARLGLSAIEDINGYLYDMVR
jgi:hypothetical protein